MTTILPRADIRLLCMMRDRQAREAGQLRMYGSVARHAGDARLEELCFTAANSLDEARVLLDRAILQASIETEV